jgi:predicted acetyltransferase
VPTTELWYVDGPIYIGTVVIRHHLTEALEREGGNIGYHVVPAHRGQGHAKRMLAAAIGSAREIGVGRVLMTCDGSNRASRRVIEAHGGTPPSLANGIVRYAIEAARPSTGRPPGRVP